MVTNCYAQIEIDSEKIYKENEVEITPLFVGGLSVFYKYIAENIKVSETSGGISGKLMMSFVVEKDGKPSNVYVGNELGKEIKTELIRLLYNMPKWIPGKSGNENKRVGFTLPIQISY